MERWYAAIEEARGMADDTIVARTPAEQAELRRLRHALPAGMNERGAKAVLAGGRKVSTDFAVPLENLPRLMEEGTRIAQGFGGFYVAYGHVGNGHPHFNLLAEDPGALAVAQECVRRMARCARELGGTLSAEHGVGKLKVALYRELYPSWLYDAMRAVKRTLDPDGILSPGNLFEE
jgi:FAD/FMN-containing dehydrogenase